MDLFKRVYPFSVFIKIILVFHEFWQTLLNKNKTPPPPKKKKKIIEKFSIHIDSVNKTLGQGQWPKGSGQHENTTKVAFPLEIGVHDHVLDLSLWLFGKNSWIQGNNISL